MTATIGSEEELEEIVYEYPDTRGEILLQCYNAIAAVEMLDPYTKKLNDKKDRVKNNCLEVIDYYISEIHAEIFDTTEDEL